MLASLLVAFGMIALICTSTYISDMGMSAVLGICWAESVNFVFTFFALASACANYIMMKKSAK